MISQYVIDREKEIRECGNCREILPFSAFSLDKVNYRNKPMPKTCCKVCKAEMGRAYRNAKKLRLEPYRYIQCDNDDCLNVYNKKLSHCPKCGLEAHD